MTLTIPIVTVIIVLAAAVPNQETLAAGSIPITRILVAPDTSGSLDGHEYQAALDGVVSIVSRLGETGSIRELAILPWAGTSDCWRTPAWRTGLPRREESPPVGINWSEAGQLFRLYRDKQLRDAEGIRRQEQERADSAYRQKLDACLTRFRVRVGECRQGRSRCTAVGEILRRSSQEGPSTLVVVITDAKEECSQSRYVPLPAGARTLVVLVPSMDESDRTDVVRDARLADLRRLAPWAMVIPSFRLADLGIDWPALLLGPGTAARPAVEPASVSASTEDLR